MLGKFGFDKTKSETKIHKLSGGEKTRLILCLISYDSPNILLLDEPTTGLDVTTQAHVLELLNLIAKDTGLRWYMSVMILEQLLK